MNARVCLGAGTIHYPKGGGHFWVFLNWALGLVSLGVDVIWLDFAQPQWSRRELGALVETLQRHLQPYGLADQVAIFGYEEASESMPGCLSFEAATSADLFLNMNCDMPADALKCFRRTAYLDIDPGMMQVWMGRGQLRLAPHDLYFTIGETVGQPEAMFPDAGLSWQYTPPCVALDWWPIKPADSGAAFTTVCHWYAGEWFEENGEYYPNDKRTGFSPFLELPSRTSQPLELCLCLDDKQGEEWRSLERRGWRVLEAHETTTSPRDYQRYIQNSLGEFSCCKPSCVRLQNAWVSDRSLCYLASGKPVIVQHTGPSRFLPDAAGMFRFRDLEEAARCLDRARSDYQRQCGLARALAEEFFDARKVARRLLERALD